MLERMCMCWSKGEPMQGALAPEHRGGFGPLARAVRTAQDLGSASMRIPSHRTFHGLTPPHLWQGTRHLTPRRTRGAARSCRGCRGASQHTWVPGQAPGVPEA